MNYCPICAKQLITKFRDERDRLCCPDSNCGFVFWNNPVPVVAGIVETQQGVILAHNKAWPAGIYSMITGYLESGESPEQAIVRETFEELALSANAPSFVGIYSFEKKNQIIIVFHLFAAGTVALNDELDDYKLVSRGQLKDWPFGLDKEKGWPFGIGYAMTDWLAK